MATYYPQDEREERMAEDMQKRYSGAESTAALTKQRDDLLAALKDLVGVFEIRDFVRPEVARARQAIAKAERQ